MTYELTPEGKCCRFGYYKCYVERVGSSSARRPWSFISDAFDQARRDYNFGRHNCHDWAKPFFDRIK